MKYIILLLILNSCNTPVEVKRVDTTANQFNNYEVTFNKGEIAGTEAIGTIAETKKQMVK